MTSEYLAPQQVPHASSEALSWTDDTVLLVMTYSKMEHYLPDVLQNLDLFWPNRPQTWIVTDGDYEADNVIRGSKASFTELLSDALSEVEAKMPWANRVFLMIEDLCPLGPVDEASLAKIVDFADAQGADYVNHRWRELRGGPSPDVGARVDVAGVDAPVHRMSDEYAWYFSVPCSVWRVEYLRAVVDAKIARGDISPWQFELPMDDPHGVHYGATDFWPTDRDGFYKRGVLNTIVLRQREFPTSPLMARLRRDFCGADSVVLVRATRRLQKELNSIRMRISKLNDTSHRGMGN